MKKVLSLILSLVMAFMTLSMLTVSAGAAGLFSNAKTMKPLETYNISLSRDAGSVYYKLTFDSTGTVTFYADSVSGAWKYELVDKNADVVPGEKGSCTKGGCSIPITKKGTYYLHCSSTSSGKLNNFYYKFTPDKKPTISIAVKATVGETIDLAGLTTNYSGKVTWSSSDKKVATVSGGVVTAVKSGKATIKASIDTGLYAQVTVKVENSTKPVVKLVQNVTIGDELDFSAMTENYKGDITWNVTDKKILSVKNGKVSTLKKGTAKLRAYTDDGIFAEITIKVK
ncbi:MAG: Ig-like domain-containing protein [Ruminiclostridium sp.]